MTIITPTGISGITSITSTGNTLQFTSASGGNLDVNGLNVTSGTNINVSGIITATSIVVAAGSTAAPSISPSGDSNTGIFFPSADTVAIGEGGTEVLRVNSSGGVGIGTTNTIISNTKVHLYSENDTRGLRITNTLSSSYSEIQFAPAGREYRIGVGGSTSAASGTSNSFYIYDTSASSTRFSIDSGGRVTIPNQPATCRRVTSGNVTNNQLVPWDTAILSSSDISYNTTTRRFTVSVSGRYEITFSGFKLNTGAARVALGVNTDTPTAASNYGHIYTSGTEYNSMNFCVILNLSANDYFTFRVIDGTLYSGSSDQFNFMSAFLIG